jgi:hypothetical protein
VPLLEQARASGAPDALPWLGYAYGATGRRREALAVAAQLAALARTQYVSPQSVAVVHLGLGDADRAMAALEQAYADRSFEVLAFGSDIFDRLHGDPRFQDLLRRIRIPVRTAEARGGVARRAS